MSTTSDASEPLSAKIEEVNDTEVTEVQGVLKTLTDSVAGQCNPEDMAIAVPTDTYNLLRCHNIGKFGVDVASMSYFHDGFKIYIAEVPAPILLFAKPISERMKESSEDYDFLIRDRREGQWWAGKYFGTTESMDGAGRFTFQKALELIQLAGLDERGRPFQTLWPVKHEVEK